MSRSIITLTTDFGIDSPYVAQMKGVILNINPAATIVDITHGIAPQNIRQGAIALRDATRYFPADSVHVAVVDPGVGTNRKVVYAEIAGRHYLAPDNGLLSLLVLKTPATRLLAVANRDLFRSQVSHTFHGRDLFAPVAAHLGLGTDPSLLGPVMSGLCLLDWPEPQIAASKIIGEVVDIDHFGNLMTNISDQMLAARIGQHRQRLEVQIGGHVIVGLARTYGEHESEQLIALFGSSGYLEVAQVGGSAARRLNAAVGDFVYISWPQSD